MTERSVNSILLKREPGNAIRVQDLIAVLTNANPDALVFVRECGFLVQPSVREVIAAPAGMGLHQEKQDADELPSILIE